MPSLQPTLQRALFCLRHMLSFSGRGLSRLLGLAVLMVAVMFAFESLSTRWYQKAQGQVVSFQHVADPLALHSPASVLPSMLHAKPALELQTRLAAHPFWVAVDLAQAQTTDSALLLHTRHLVSGTCWQMATQGQQFEFWSTDDDPNPYSRYQSGIWQLPIEEFGLKGQVLCKLQFVGPATLRVGILPRGILHSTDTLQAEKRRGFLEGALVLLMACVIAIALFTQSSLFWAYAVWLFFSLRLATLFDGWDHEFFGFEIPLAWVPISRQLALAGYFTSTVTLSVLLFDNLRREPFASFTTTVFGVTTGFWILALFASYAVFLQVYWPLSLLCLGFFVVVAARQAATRRDAISICYLFVLSITLGSSLMELLQVWFNFRLGLVVPNSTSITLACSLMTAILLAEKFRQILFTKRRVRERLHQVNRRFQNVFHRVPTAMFTSGDQGHLLGYNAQFERLFLNAHAEPVHAAFSSAALRVLFQGLTDGDGVQRLEIELKTGQHAFRAYELTVSRDAGVLVGIVDDISSHKQKQRELQYQVYHDELTGVLNRRGLQASLHDLIKPDQPALEIWLIDICRFAQLSLIYGSQVGDRVLMWLANQLTGLLCSSSALARVGVDQFAIIRPRAEQGASTQFNLSQQLVEVDGLSFQVECLVCRAEVAGPLTGCDVTRALEEVLRRSKSLVRQNPGLKCVIWTERQVAAFIGQSAIQRSLGQSQLPENLVLQWQPILDLQHHQGLIHAEALLRLTDAAGINSQPADFLEACAQGGLIEHLDEWVLGRVLSFLEEHQRELRGLHQIHINVSPHSLNSARFTAQALALFQRYSSVCHQVCIEITEVGLVFNRIQVRAFLMQLKSLGIHVALDDFGAGYCNFNYTADLPCDVVKIDGSLITGLTKSPENQAVVKAIVSLCHELGRKCVAEWVEDKPTFDMVRHMGMDFVQGYLVGRAMAPEHFFGKTSALQFIDSEALLASLSNV